CHSRYARSDATTAVASARKDASPGGPLCSLVSCACPIARALTSARPWLQGARAAALVALVGQMILAPLARMLEQMILAPLARMLEQMILAPLARMLEQMILAPLARMLEQMILAPLARMLEQMILAPLARMLERARQRWKFTHKSRVPAM